MSSSSSSDPSDSDELIPGVPGELVERYLAGEHTPRESAKIQRLLAEHPEVNDALRAYLEGLGTADDPPDLERSWAAVRDRRDVRVPVRPPTVVPGLPVRSGRWLLPIGLAAAACLTLGLFARSRVDLQHVEHVARVYTTRVGQRATLTLADGTTITMAPSSELRLAADFGDRRRDVSLTGEAYFVVAHDSTRPFTVVAGPVLARDIGTAYGVRNYADEGAVRVAVREGRVDVTGAGILGAGDVARRAPDGVTQVQHGAAVDGLLGWTEGGLTYRNTPLAEVRGDLRRWYGIDVVVGRPSIDTVRFTGTLSGKPVRDVVALLAATLGLRATWQGHQAVLQ